MKLSTFTTQSGEELLYTGAPDLNKLEVLAQGAGDLWHSSLDQGFAYCFPEIIYQMAVYWWFLNDFDQSDVSINWRVNADNFVVRKLVWDQAQGFDHDYESKYLSGLEFGYNLLRNQGGVPLYVKGLFEPSDTKIKINTLDRYKFFIKNFKKHHSYYMMFRRGLFRLPFEYYQLKKATKLVQKKNLVVVKPRTLNEINGKPTVSLVVPTMKRQEFTQRVLEDHKKQTYLIKEAVIVDATPEEERDASFYRQEDFPFEVKVKWQTSKGSCRARNEAIELCTGDYIIFADDDIRIQPDFVENHIRLLQTYNAEACNGLDIMAQHTSQDLTDLAQRLDQLGEKRWIVGASATFSNANSCVKRELVLRLNGNDINFDGGYGEDSDFGLRILKSGATLLHNPFSPNLHLKPPTGGYRWWGTQSRNLGKKRKQQPWELDKPVKYIRPVPSPTITYGVLKHFTKDQIKEWRFKHFTMYLLKGSKKQLFMRLLKWPYKQVQFNKSLMYAKNLIKLGARYK